jgi:hypothetical protein
MLGAAPTDTATSNVRSTEANLFVRLPDQNCAR